MDIKGGWREEVLTFEKKCAWRIMLISWTVKITNEAVWSELGKKHCYYIMWKHAYYIALDAYSFRRNWASSKHSLQDWQREQQAEGGKQDCIDIVVQWMKLDALCFDQLSQRQEILKVNYAVANLHSWRRKPRYWTCWNVIPGEIRVVLESN